MKNLTEVIFLLDRSGSMHSLTEDTIGGFNSFIEQQKKLEGEMVINTILFDDHYEVLHDCKNIKDINPITDRNYYTRGMTALNDAIGKSISEVGERINNMSEEYKPENVIVIITTDGEENSSREYELDTIKSLIEEKKKQDWGFIFLGADIDSFKTGGSMGIGSGSTLNYEKSRIGTQALYASLNVEISNCRGLKGYTGAMGGSSHLSETYTTVLDELKKGE